MVCDIGCSVYSVLPLGFSQLTFNQAIEVPAELDILSEKKKSNLLTMETEESTNTSSEKDINMCERTVQTECTPNENEQESMMEMSLSGSVASSTESHVINPESSIVTDVLKFLLPGMCHLSAEDEARTVFLQNNGHELLAQYFQHQWHIYTTSTEHREAEVGSMF